MPASGLQGRLLGKKVREERVLADRKLAKSGGQPTAVSGPLITTLVDAYAAAVKSSGAGGATPSRSA